MTREEAKIWLFRLYARADITDEYDEMEDMQPYEEAVIMAIKALEQEPCNTDTCKVVKAYMNEWDKPITAEPKTGHWIMDSDEEHGHCDQCGYKTDLVNGDYHNFCRKCGARMVGDDNG